MYANNMRENQMKYYFGFYEKYEPRKRTDFGDFKTRLFAYLQAERRPGTISHFKLAIKYFENFAAPKYL